MKQENIIINIGRQLGSGGRTIAKKLAENLDYKFFDKEILNIAAKESGFDESFFEKNDEKKGFLKSALHLLTPSSSEFYMYNNKLSDEELFKFQSEVILKESEKQSCVFVGRCADYILRERKNVINVFITADLQDRIKRIMERCNCDEALAAKIINTEESKRASYYNFYTGKKWGNSESYHLCVNTSALGIEDTVEYIKSFVTLKAKYKQ